MGHGVYSSVAYEEHSRSLHRETKTASQIFESRRIDPEMDPKEITIRESRDSIEHPESVAVIVGLDVTGSMGFVPEYIVRKGLPTLMDSILQAGVSDPQVMFMGIGDHVYDKAPVQVGQFESSAELLDRWLTKVYLEGGGGGNNWESYTLAWLIAARHTAMDCLDKRGKKGFLFTIGDEPMNPNIPGDFIKRNTSESDAQSITSASLFEEVSKKYEVFHLHILHNSSSSEERRKEGWKETIGQRFIEVKNYEDIPKIIANLVVDNYVVEKVKETVAGSVAEKPVEEML